MSEPTTAEERAFWRRAAGQDDGRVVRLPSGMLVRLLDDYDRLAAERDRAAREREPLPPGTDQHTALCHALATMISDISECEYSAGWMRDIEYELWRYTRGGAEHGYYGHTDGDHLATLRALSALIGGWVVWQDAAPHWRYATTAEMEGANGD